MNKKQYNLFNTFIWIFISAFVLSGSLALSFRWDVMQNFELYRIFIKIFASVTAAAAVIIIISLFTDRGRKVWERYSKEQKKVHLERLESQHINELKNYNYSGMKEYDGLEYFCPRCIFMDVAQRIKIDKNGVVLMRWGKPINTLKWDKVKVIGIGETPFGYSDNSNLIYISVKDMKQHEIPTVYDQKENMIMAWANPKIMHCIMKYWDKGINNLDTQKRWLKYIRKLH